MDHNQQKRLSRLKKCIVVLGILLAISCAALAGKIFYARSVAPAAVVTVPGNRLSEEAAQPTAFGGSGAATGRTQRQKHGAPDSGATLPAGEEATRLELFRGQPAANEKFHADNLFPGDQLTRYYCVRVNHDQPVQIFFRCDITDQTKSLGDGLEISVTRLGGNGALCAGTFSEVNGKTWGETFQPSARGVTELYYRVDVSADTSLGNEYQQASLDADFTWYAQDVSAGGTVPSVTAAPSGTAGSTAPSATAAPSSNVTALTLPQTGDRFPLTLLVVIAAAALVMVVVLWTKRMKEKKNDGRR